MKRSAALRVALAMVATGTLASCATFNRNDVAARAGRNELSQEAAQALIKGADPQNNGAQMRAELTAWVRLAAVADSKGLTIDGYEQQVQANYDKGAASGGPLCLRAIRVASMADTAPVLAAIQGGMAFTDAVAKYSLDDPSTGGVVKDQQGNECLAQATLRPEVVDAVKDAATGVPVAHDFGTFVAVLMLRPFSDLSAATRTALINTGFTDLELAEALKTSGVWVDSRYGAWNPLSESVEPMRS